MSWTDTARAAIAQIHAGLPADATYADRVKALRDGYPFSLRRGWAYKAWLKARADYLNKYGEVVRRPHHDKQANFDAMLSPLDRAKARGERAVAVMSRCPTCGKPFKCVDAHHLIKHGGFVPK